MHHSPSRRRWLPQAGAALSRGAAGNPARGFITATQAALAGPAKRVAIVQCLDRLAGDWALANRAADAQAHTQLTRLPIEAARIITRRAAIATRPVTQADLAALHTRRIRPRGMGSCGCRSTWRE